VTDLNRLSDSRRRLAETDFPPKRYSRLPKGLNARLLSGQMEKAKQRATTRPQRSGSL